MYEEMAPKPLWHVFKVTCHNHVTPFALCLKSHTWARETKLLSPTSESHLALDCIKRPDQKAFQISGGGGWSVTSEKRSTAWNKCVIHRPHHFSPMGPVEGLLPARRGTPAPRESQTGHRAARLRRRVTCPRCQRHWNFVSFKATSRL